MFWCHKSVCQAAVRRQRFLCCMGWAPFCCSQVLSAISTQLLLWEWRWFTKDWSNTTNKTQESTTSFLDFLCFPYSHSKKPSITTVSNLNNFCLPVKVKCSPVHLLGVGQSILTVIGSKSQRFGHLASSLCGRNPVHTYLCWFSTFPD